MKHGEVVVTHVYFNFTKFYQKSFINSLFSCSEYQSVSRIVHWGQLPSKNFQKTLNLVTSIKCTFSGILAHYLCSIIYIYWYSLQDISYRLKNILQRDFGILYDDIEKPGRIEDLHLTKALNILKEKRRQVKNVMVFYKSYQY